MDKKEKLEDLLDSLSPEQIEELQSLLQKSSVTSRDTKKKKRRGKRRRKRREAAKAREEREARKTQEKKQSPSAEDFLSGIKLTKAEREQLEEASKSDKAMGVHEPRDSPRPRKNKTDHRVEMRCRICGKDERVSPALVPPERDRFKCNECCCRAG
jgi:hypothetical protein